jgi:DMSO/TMAO reductase YedYZ molybdopterin-dependent catalytic subunit
MRTLVLDCVEAARIEADKDCYYGWLGPPMTLILTVPTEL